MLSLNKLAAKILINNCNLKKNKTTTTWSSWSLNIFFCRQTTNDLKTFYLETSLKGNEFVNTCTANAAANARLATSMLSSSCLIHPRSHLYSRHIEAGARKKGKREERGKENILSVSQQVEKHHQR